MTEFTNLPTDPAQEPVQEPAEQEPTVTQEEAPIQELPGIPEPPVKQAPIVNTMMPIRMYAVTIADQYPADSIQYEKPEYRQIYYYNAYTEAEVINRLREQYPDLKSFTVEVA